MSEATTTMDVDAGTRAKRAATGGEERTVVASRVAAICDMIEHHREAGKPLTSSQVATISSMIDDVAGTKAPPPRTGRRSSKKKRCMISVGSYEDEGVVGEGRFGVVFRARHRGTGQDAAVKSYRSDYDDSIKDDGTRMLLREACFMAACGAHPSVVGFHAVACNPWSSNNGGYSLVMEYVGPSNLGQVLDDREGRPLPEAEARRMMRQLLDGAAAMHQHGIVHRDIKPGNILVVADNNVKIGDLGLAKSMHEKAAPFFMAGTRGYMAPEMLLWTEDHDAAVDAWSLGCVMAELVTGKMLPFEGKDEMDQLYKIFDVVGVPGKRAWRAMKPHEDLDDDVQQWRARQRRLGHRNRLREMVPEEVLSRDGFEVLKGLLTTDPKKRLTAADALRCPWFANNSNDDVVDTPVADTAASRFQGQQVVVTGLADRHVIRWACARIS
ncbi:hypothetical protein PR202_ga00290 [Eleusine coracana subsp. coracana]|uniref:Protein kinase domain-containing protein n=1 Tax=Eleusine coracana subsp. coracana TaxID=191504 RepID=A0AAV5BG45_ELECO|nr:hypothetical protein PR202_ga00290 [Eleusine coracana subsp. coracana]